MLENLIFIGLVGLMAMGFAFVIVLFFIALKLGLVGVKVAVRMVRDWREKID